MPLVKRKPGTVLTPVWQTDDGRTVRLYHGNVLDTLQRMQAKSVQCIVTSPPYWGLRDYGNNKTVEIGSEKVPDCLGWARGTNCGECHVCRMTLVCRELRRVLRDDGTFWLNYGDSYNANKGTPTKIDLPAGNMVGIPWRVALALQADGWVLRQDIIWHKPSPMPESVRNRCTKAHEYVFLLTKSVRYFYDADAIKTNSLEPGRMVKQGAKSLSRYSGGTTGNAAEGVTEVMCPVSSNKRSVWTIRDGDDVLRWFAEHEPAGYQRFAKAATDKSDVWTVASQGFPDAHFATFPPNLIRDMILAGTSAHGCCADCGAPWRRVTEETKLRRERPNDYVKRTGEAGTGNSCANSVAGVESKTIGWEPTCECDARRKKFDHGPAGIKPCVVLDPFVGSGTTCVVSLELGRHSVGIDLSEKYIRTCAVPRITAACLNGNDEQRALVDSQKPKTKPLSWK